MARKPFDPAHATAYKPPNRTRIQPLKVQPLVKPVPQGRPAESDAKQPPTTPPTQRSTVSRASAPVPPPPPPFRPPIAPVVTSAEPVTPPAEVPARSGSSRWRWFVLWMSLVAFCGGTGVSALLWLSTVPPLPNCQQVSLLAADADRLYCAQQAARSGKLEALLSGIKLVEPWTKEHPLYSKAQQLMAEWSQAILALARQKIDQNDVEGAIALAQKIPANSPTRKEAEAAIARWRKASQQGETIYQNIQTLLKTQQWQQALEATRTLANLDSDQWRDRLGDVRRQISMERQAWRQFQQAQFAASGVDQVTALGQALALTQKINPQSYAYQKAQTTIALWSKTLLEIATNRMQSQDTTGAIAAIQQLPIQTPLPPDLQDMVWVSRAQQLVSPKQILGQPLLKQIWNLSIVLPAIRQVRSASPFYQQAQTYRTQMEQQMQDLLHLQVANSFARQGYAPGLELAIRYAQAVAPDRPGRVYAQTLVAQWRKEIQRIEDRPDLLRAQELAKAGTIPQLKAAIAQASNIAPGRALRPEAQAAIFRWNRQIQTIEDKPILDQAQTLAKQGKLADAIRIASKIRASRALYKESQTAIQGWVTQLQIAEDRPILNEAWALADQGSLTAAINLASQIRPGRALYAEAQAEIDRWMLRRAAIYRSRESVEAPPEFQDQREWEGAPPEREPPEAPPQPPDAADFPYPDALR